MQLSNRTTNALSRAGITTLEQLKAMSRADMMAIKGLGKMGVTEIEKLLSTPEKPDMLTVRDHFAALAMQALAKMPHDGQVADDICLAAYAYADAMMKHRANGDAPQQVG